MLNEAFHAYFMHIFSDLVLLSGHFLTCCCLHEICNSNVVLNITWERPHLSLSEYPPNPSQLIRAWAGAQSGIRAHLLALVGPLKASVGIGTGGIRTGIGTYT